MPTPSRHHHLQACARSGFDTRGKSGFHKVARKPKSGPRNLRLDRTRAAADSTSMSETHRWFGHAGNSSDPLAHDNTYPYVRLCPVPLDLSHGQAAVLWGSLSCCTTWRLNVSRIGSATHQPRMVHVVVAAQSPADDGRATYATPLAAGGEICPRSYLHVSR
jgi:hypothetical protein